LGCSKLASGIEVDGKEELKSARLISSGAVGSRQSQWPAKQGGVFKAARKTVNTVPFGVVPPVVVFQV
jgi:hypothetical protein